jgi:hypothetical protein
MKIEIRKPEARIYESDFYSFDPQDHEIMFRETARELEKVGIDIGKELVKPNGESIKIEKIEYFPKTHSMILIADGQDLPAGKIIELVNNGALTIR